MVAHESFIPAFCTRESAFGINNGEEIGVVVSLGESALTFLSNLNLSETHPACHHPELIQRFYNHTVDYIPKYPIIDFHHAPYRSLINLWNQSAPALLAMSELWLRLFSFYVAPLCLAILLHVEVTTSSSLFVVPRAATSSSDTALKHASATNQTSSTRKNETKLNWLCVIGLACSSTLLTDPLYVHEFGRQYGAAMFTLMCLISFKRFMNTIRSSNESSDAAPTSSKSRRRRSTAVAMLILLSVAYQTLYHLVLHPEDTLADIPQIEPGLYYSNQNEFVSKIVQHWPSFTRTYENRKELVLNHNQTIPEPTPWTITGDSRTGIPFIINPSVPLPMYHRVWIPADDENEEIIKEDGGATVIVEANALDIAFPIVNNKAQHFTNEPIFVILHGLNGGSDEEYVKQLVHQQLAKNSTSIVMIARGLMGTPIIGTKVFHGARVSDMARTANAIKHAMMKSVLGAEDQSSSSRMSRHTPVSSPPPLIGVGYSMGAIILANYVARSGNKCALDGAVSVSGGLDMKEQYHFQRSMRLWQPMLAQELRETILRGARQQYEHKLSEEHFLNLLRSIHITEIDEFAVVKYNGFRDVMHYYTEMSALGDYDSSSSEQQGRIANVSIPMLVLHALDDPLITWRSVGPPTQVVESGKGFTMHLLTKSGGHVGWPLGLNPRQYGWNWMNDAVDGFATALVIATREKNLTE